jgi:hypothetical protein
MTRRILFALAFALAHTAVTIWALISALGATMSGFEPGATQASPARVRFFGGVVDTLMFPLGRLDLPGATGLWGHLILLTNGLLWAAVILACWTAVDRLRARRITRVPDR